MPGDYLFQGFKLGQWVTVQRSGWDSLQPDRRERLAALPGWAVSVRDAWWEGGYAQLQQYAGENGHAGPPQSYTSASGFRLGSWVATQRQSHAKGQLSDERRRRLLSLPGWEWSMRSGPTG